MPGGILLDLYLVLNLDLELVGRAGFYLYVTNEKAPISLPTRFKLGSCRCFFQASLHAYVSVSNILLDVVEIFLKGSYIFIFFQACVRRNERCRKDVAILTEVCSLLWSYLPYCGNR